MALDLSTAATDLSRENNPFRADFPLLMRNPELTFIDSAATSQRVNVALDAQQQFYETMNSNPLRGLYRLSILATQTIECARGKIAHFIGASDPHEVVIVRNASEALNVLALSYGAANLEPGDEVCISIMEHHSNLIPWQKVCKQTGATLVYLRPNEEGFFSKEELDAKIGKNTKIVSVAHVSNVLGVELPVKEIAWRAHEVGAKFFVDGAQSAPHLKIDVDEIGCDAFVFSAHKMFGPMGIGVLWGKRELLEGMEPLLTGGEMIEHVTETDAFWAPIPQKFEAGTQDAAGIAGLSAAIDYIQGIGHETLAARETALTVACMERLSELPYVKIYGPKDPEKHVGVVSFNLEGIHPHDVSSIVDSENVAIRVGHHCAEPLMQWMNIQSCCRVSWAIYNDLHDLDELIRSLDVVWRIFHGA